jgi:hypothetical protein
VHGASLQNRGVRERFPILSRLTYLNSCSQGALSTDVREAYELLAALARHRELLA